MFCKHCGARIDDGSTFCSACGKQLLDNTSDLSSQQKEGKTPVPIQERKWYIRDENGSHGPYSYSDFERQIRNNMFDLRASIRSDKDTNWMSIQDSPFAELLNNAVTDVSPSDKWLWSLALIPLIVSIAIAKMGLFPAGSFVPSIIVFLLNSVFFILDLNELSKYNQFKKYMYIGFILVPIYLIVRPIKTDKNFFPLIIWICLFIASFFL